MEDEPRYVVGPQLSADQEIDGLASSLDDLIQMIRNRNRLEAAPGSESWDFLRTELYRITAKIWQTLAMMRVEGLRWPRRN